MNSYRLIVFLCTLLCSAVYGSSIYNYQLPDGGVVNSLNITVDNRETRATALKFSVQCYNYDSLKYLENRQVALDYRIVSIELTLVGCFNNGTNNENYTYRLWDIISSNVDLSKSEKLYELQVILDEYAAVNSDTLLENFDFTKFWNTQFKNFGFETSRYLSNFRCENCKFSDTKHFDFNDIRANMILDYLTISRSELINLNSENLKKLSTFYGFGLNEFSLADHNAFNVPRLFEHNEHLSHLAVDGSKHKIILHEDVLRGLHKLITLKLRNLQLDYIPENLFIDLHKIQDIILTSNNIQTLHPNTFAHVKPRNIELNDNPIFTMPHDKIEYLNITAENVFLGNFTANTLDVVEALLNSQITFLHFQTLLVDPIDVHEFTNMDQNRKHHKSMDVLFSDTKVALDMEYVKLHSTPKNGPMDRNSRERGESINVVVTLPIKQSLCDDCWMMKRFVENYFEQRDIYPEFYIRQGRVLIKPQVSCARQEYRFELIYEKNCPTNCACRYNGLVDKIVIDCERRNLTEIPVIPYPEQFDNIAEIHLHFKGNLLTDLTFENQNPKVLEKLSTLDFRYNQIVSAKLPTLFKQTVHVLDVCGNNGLIGAKNNEFEIAAGYFRYRRGLCSKGSPIRVGLYLEENKSDAEIEDYLDAICSTS